MTQSRSFAIVGPFNWNKLQTFSQYNLTSSLPKNLKTLTRAWSASDLSGACRNV